MKEPRGSAGASPYQAVDLSLDGQLATSFPVEEGANQIRHLPHRDVSGIRIGVNTRYADDVLQFSIPIMAATDRKRNDDLS